MPLNEVRHRHDLASGWFRERSRCRGVGLWKADTAAGRRRSYRDDRAALSVSCPVMLIGGREERSQAACLELGVGAAECGFALLGVVTSTHLCLDGHSRIRSEVAFGVVELRCCRRRPAFLASATRPLRSDGVVHQRDGAQLKNAASRFPNHFQIGSYVPGRAPLCARRGILVAVGRPRNPGNPCGCRVPGGTPGGTRTPNLLIRRSPSAVHSRPQPSTQA